MYSCLSCIKFLLLLVIQVKSLKEKIEAETDKEFPATGQKLIYAGNVLAGFEFRGRLVAKCSLK